MINVLVTASQKANDMFEIMVRAYDDDGCILCAYRHYDTRSPKYSKDEYTFNTESKRRYVFAMLDMMTRGRQLTENEARGVLGGKLT